MLAGAGAVAVVVAIAGAAYAVSGGDGGGGSPGGGGGDRPSETTEIDRNGLPVAGPANPPPTGMAEFDQLAQSCFAGTMADCDTLYWDAGVAISPQNPTAPDYQIYGSTCGGRRPDQVGLCVRAFADA